LFADIKVATDPLVAGSAVLTTVNMAAELVGYQALFTTGTFYASVLTATDGTDTVTTSATLTSALAAYSTTTS